MSKTFLWDTEVDYTRNIKTDKEESKISGHFFIAPIVCLYA